MTFITFVHYTKTKYEIMLTNFEMKKNPLCCTIVAILDARLLPNVLYS